MSAMTGERMQRIIGENKIKHHVRTCAAPADWRQHGYVAYCAAPDVDDEAEALDAFAQDLEAAGVPIAADVEQDFVPHPRGGSCLVAFIKFGQPEGR